MKYFLLLFLFANYLPIYAQKPFIDSSVFRNWPSVIGAAISDDGNFVLYTINNQPAGSSTLIVQATNNHWKIAIPNVEPQTARFTNSSKQVIFPKQKDSLGIITLGGDIEYVSGISSFKFPERGKGEWLAYQIAGLAKQLIVRNLLKNDQRVFPDVWDYQFDKSGKILVIETAQNDTVIHALNWVNLGDGNCTSIWR
jgi:hypothetical protein